MQDSTITITVTAVDGATKVFEGVGDSAVKQASRAATAWQKVNDVSNVAIESTGGAADATNKASKAQDNFAASSRRSYFAQTALTTILSAGINKAFLTMVDVTGQAIQRVDLIANFPKTMESLGISANDASASLSKLSAYVASVGGNLQDATSTVTRFTETTKNVQAATAEFEGVNNALIAGGGSAQDQANALEQLTQAYSRGVPQLTEWRSLMVAMPAQLSEVAKAMKLPNAQALGEDLTKGKISMQDFMTELAKLGTGTGPIAAQANAHLSGIQFGFNQFKNALVTGMTEIIQAIGRQNITDFFALLTGTVKQLAAWAVDLIGILFSLFNTVSQVFGGPTLKLANDNTAGIASNLGDSADNAGDLANNLDAANKAASAGLATFDKMNVLTLPSGSTAATPSGAGGLSPSDASSLDGIFADMNAQMQKITGAAKILAGIIAGLAGIKFAQGLLNQFNGLVSTIKEAQKNFSDFQKALLGGTDKDGKQVDGLVQKMGKLGTSIGGVGTQIANGIIAAISGAFATAGKAIFAPLIDGAVAAGSAIIEGLALVGAIVAEILLLPEEIALGVLVVIGAVVVGAIAAISLVIIKNWNTIITAIETAVTTFAGWIVTAWNAIVGAIAAIWDTLVSIFGAPFTFIVQFIEATFVLIIALVALFVQGVVLGFVALVSGVFDVLSAVAGWINTNVIQPVLSFFVGLWDAVVSAVTIAWSFIFVNILAPIGGWINANVIQPVLSFFTGLWNTIVSLASGVFSGIVNVLSPLAGWIFNNVISPIAGFFSSLWDGVKIGLSGLLTGIQTLISGLGGILKAPINAIFTAWNNVANEINKVKVPSWVPGIGGDNVNFPHLTLLAQGGVVDQPTLAVVGEQGKEAIMPLENNTEWISQLASKINSANGGGNGQPINLTVQIGEDKVANKIINLINEKTQMSGRNTILV